MINIEQALPDLAVTMIRDNLSAIPHVDFPPGYTIRAYRPDDVAHWLHLHRIGDPFNDDDLFTEAYFAKQFGTDSARLQSRMFYVESASGEVAGGISAWFTNEQPARGRIHWVIVHPDHRRRGLTRPMMVFIVVLLPDALPPSRQTISPCLTSSDTPPSAII